MLSLLRGGQVIVILATLIYFYQMREKINVISYMKSFYWYPLIGSLVGLIWVLEVLNFVPKNTFNYFNSLSLIFHFAFLCSFIIKILHHSYFQRYLSGVFWIFLIIITFFLLTEADSKNPLSFVIINTGLFAFCIVYYYDLFQHLPTYNLFQEPSFWVVTGIFCGVSFNIPALLFGRHLLDGSSDLKHTLGWLAPFGYLLMHLFFLKAIKCSTQTLEK